jgi:energy-coupling factor transporter ATP-binding protein EcfA2
MLYNPPNFLVLDEPTNHLDLATKEMLVEALKEFEGTMIFVSHDRMFLRGLGSRVVELGGESGSSTYVEYVRRWGMRRRGYATSHLVTVSSDAPFPAPVALVSTRSHLHVLVGTNSARAGCLLLGCSNPWQFFQATGDRFRLD